MAVDAAAAAAELMLAVAGAVAAVWVVLLGAAWVARFRLGWGRGPSLMLVAACYGAFALSALAVLSPTERGLLGAAGMMVPLAVACALVVMVRR